ncbi:MAG: hypothetical protein HDT28_00705 [Clostridiales bacterium]|nr:hypothetical protein [Clostridiales bacterium]
MLRERLKEMELRITELADYLQVSRPTMYKFIEYYDYAKFDLINKDILALFNYITENELAGKKNVINFILTNLVRIQESGVDGNLSVISAVENMLKSNPKSKKSRFLTDCFLTDEFNDIICYLVDVSDIIQKDNLTTEEKKKIQPYIELKKQIKLTED